MCAKDRKLNTTELVLTQARGLGGRAVVWKGSCVRVPALARLHARVPIMISTGEAYGSLGYIYMYFVWGDVFNMPVLSVIGQTFTLRLYEALGRGGLGLEITYFLAEML